MNSLQFQKYKDIPLPRRTLARRHTELAADVSEQLKEACKGPDLLFSQALDDSYDVTDRVQLLIFICATTPSFEVYEEILDLATITSSTRAMDILSAVNKACSNHCLDISKLVSVCIDGAPAMLGATGGYVTLLKQQFQAEYSDNPLYSLYVV